MMQDANIHIANEYAKFVAKQSWDYFVTFTTRYELTLKSTRRLMERFMEKTGNESFMKQRLFWVAERYECKDGFHAHGLLASRLDYKDLVQAYQVVTGAKRSGDWSAITLKKYNSSQAAAKYCAKYILKRYSDYDFL
jgi:hypothetical protein